MNKNIKITALIFMSIVLCGSCDDFRTNGLILDETNDKNYNIYDMYVDEFGNRGVIAYNVPSSLASYIMIVSVDESIETWGSAETSIYPTDSISTTETNSICYGIGVLQRMIELGIEDFPAQNWCNKKNHNNNPYTGSWHLPTYHEIRLLMDRSYGINETISEFGGTIINDTVTHWTCQEDYIGDYYTKVDSTNKYGYNPANRALVYPLVKDNPSDRKYSNYRYYSKANWSKTNKYHVRAVKYIYYKL